MAFIYKPLPQYMVPNGQVIDPAADNTFSLIVSGQTCIAYRLRMYDMQNTAVTLDSTGRVDLAQTLYDGDTLSIAIHKDQIAPGSTYKWQVELYACDLPVQAVNTGASTLTVLNHNLSTGDVVFVASDAALPSPLKAYTAYYVRKLDNNTLALFEQIEGARNDAGRIVLTSAGSGSITVSNVTSSEQALFQAYNDPVVSFPSTVITGQSYTFAPQYSHPQGVLPTKFEVFIEIDDGSFRVESGEIHRSNIVYQYDGLFSGRSYNVKFIITTAVGQVFDTGYVNFSVEYDTPNLGLSPAAVNSRQAASMDVAWSGIVQIIGDAAGSYSYVPSALGGGLALQLGSASSLKFTGLDIHAGSSLPLFRWRPLSADFSGAIMEAYNSETGDRLTVGYNGINFYREINGVTFNNLQMQIYPSIVYLICATRDELYVNVVGNTDE